MLKMITVWYKYYDDNDPKLNHIEDGWSKDEFPKPIKSSFANQEAWRKSELRRRPRKFSLNNFLIYIAVAFLAVFLFWFVDYPPNALTVFRSLNYYIMSIVAAFIY